jgi:DNA-binding NtrC family response regulator
MTKQTGNILILDDDEHILLTTKVVLKKHFNRVKVLSSPANLLQTLQQQSFEVVLLDMNFSAGSTSGAEGLKLLKLIVETSPNTYVILMTAYGDINLAVKGMKLGAMDFVVKPWDNDKLVATVRAACKFSQSKQEIKALKQRENILIETINQPTQEIIGDSMQIQKVFDTIAKVGPTDADALILGENGTGKELIAREIHNQSSRRDKAFVHVDLGAISESLFESELFGHEKGAFTDAKEQRIGRFELADGGTLFLDEIGNLSLPLQAKLLSAIQNRGINRVGSATTIPVNIRLICATNLSLKEMARQQTFREDLLFRINTVEIIVPPLRERGKDVLILARYFLEKFCKKYNKPKLKFSLAAGKKLARYHWPGNIRELMHLVERGVIMSEGNILQVDDFVLTHQPETKVSEGSLNLEDLEKSAISLAINKHNGNLSKAASELGLGRTTLYRKMEKYEL